MVSWVVDLLFTFLLRMLWSGASTSFSVSLHWASSQGDFHGVTGCASLGGGTTFGCGTNLVGVNIVEITEVASDTGLGCWKNIWGLFSLLGTGNPTVFGSATLTFRFWLGGGVEGLPGGC